MHLQPSDLAQRAIGIVDRFEADVIRDVVDGLMVDKFDDETRRRVADMVRQRCEQGRQEVAQLRDIP